MSVGGGRYAPGEALFADLEEVSRDTLGTFSVMEVARFDDAPCCAAGRQQVHSVEMAWSIANTASPCLNNAVIPVSGITTAK